MRVERPLARAALAERVEMTDDIKRQFVDAEGVARRIGVSKSMVAILVEKGILPPPRELTPRTKRWDLDAIDAAMRSGGLPAVQEATVADLSRGIADGILAKRRLPPAKATRRRHG